VRGLIFEPMRQRRQAARVGDRAARHVHGRRRHKLAALQLLEYWVGQDYADQRYYSAGMGRFWSPDRGGIKTANPLNPFTWNRYAYANGDPVNFNDPRGMYACDSDDGDSCGDDCDDDDSCGDDGGGSSDGGDGSDRGGSGPGTCTADTCITVTATQALVPTVTAPLPVVLPPTFTDTVLGFINTVVGYAGNTIGATIIMVLNPTATAACDTLTCQAQNGPKPGSRDESCWNQYQGDLAVCRQLKSASCCDQAAQRYASCLRVHLCRHFRIVCRTTRPCIPEAGRFTPWGSRGGLGERE
jgi:RHS repeat-associated protein